MLKEIKYLFFLVVIIVFFFLLFNHYTSEENIKKTFRNYSSLENKIDKYGAELPVLIGDTSDIVKYLNKEESSNKKKYFFWDLLKNEN